MLVDSHCHLHMIDYDALGLSREQVIQAALENDIEHMLCVGTDLNDLDDILPIAESHPAISASVGLHPNEMVENEPGVDHLITLAKHPKIVAIGETGLDYYRTDRDNAWQKERFIHHIEVAKRIRKPLIIHTRQARQDTLEILRSEKANDVGGVIHCFTEDWQTAKGALDLGFYISFSGIVTFKNALDIQEVAKRMPMDRMLVETDAPFLAPVPYRGKINQPTYVKEVANYIAHLREIPFKELAETTTQNYYQLFKKST